MGQLVVVAFAAGALTIFFLAADTAYLPTLVTRTRLLEANSGMTLGRSVAGAVGPTVAGFVVQAVTAPLAIVVDALSYVVSAALTFRIRADEPAPGPSVGTSIWASVAEGIRFAMGNPFLRTVTVAAALNNFGANVVGAIFILYAARELGIVPVGIGFVTTALSVGTVVGALVCGRITGRFGVGPAFVLNAAVIVLGSAATPAAGLVPPVALHVLVVGQALIGFAMPIFNVNFASVLQAVTPDRLLGRVSNGIRFFTGGTMPLGALLGGALGDVIGLQSTLVLGVALIGLGAIALVASPIRTMRALPEAALV